jgi:hypothetical protein
MSADHWPRIGGSVPRPRSSLGKETKATARGTSARPPAKTARKQLLGKAPVGSLPRKGRSAARSLPTSFQIATYLVGYLPNGPIWVHVIKDESNSHLNEARNQTEVSSRRGQIRRTVIKSAQIVFNER